MGDFVADIYRQAVGADVALVNGGSIRADTTIAPGVMTKRDVLSVLPFNNKIVKIQITGAVLRAALEHGVASIGVEAQPGRFPQVSGIRFAYDATKKAGARLTEVTVNGAPLDDKKSYTLAASDYVVIKGGDGYKMFADPTFIIRPEQAPSDSESLQKAIRSVSAIAPKTDGRIRRIDTPQDQDSCK